MDYKVSQYGAFIDGSGLSVTGSLPTEGTIFTTFTIPSAGGDFAGTLFSFGGYTVHLSSAVGSIQLELSDGSGTVQRTEYLSPGQQFRVGASYDPTQGGGQFLFALEGTNSPYGEYVEWGYTPTGFTSLSSGLYVGLPVVVSDLGFSPQTFGSSWDLDQALRDPSTTMPSSTTFQFDDLAGDSTVMSSDGSSSISATGSLTSKSLVPTISLTQSGQTIRLYEDSDDGQNIQNIQVSIEGGVLESNSNSFALKIEGGSSPHSVNINSITGESIGLDGLNLGSWSQLDASVQAGEYTYLLIRENYPDYVDAPAAYRYSVARLDASGALDNSFGLREFFSDDNEGHLAASPDGNYFGFWTENNTNGQPPDIVIEDVLADQVVTWTPSDTSAIDGLLTNDGHVAAINGRGSSTDYVVNTYDPFGMDPYSVIATSASFSNVSDTYEGRQEDGAMVLTQSGHLVFSGNESPTGSLGSFIVVDLATGVVTHPQLPSSISGSMSGSVSGLKLAADGSLLVSNDTGDLVQFNLVTETLTTILPSSQIGASSVVSASGSSFYLVEYPPYPETDPAITTPNASVSLANITKYLVVDNSATVDSEFGNGGTATVPSSQVPTTGSSYNKLVIGGDVYSYGGGNSQADVDYNWNQVYDLTNQGFSYSSYDDWSGNRYLDVNVNDSSVSYVILPVSAVFEGIADEPDVESFDVALVSDGSYLVNSSSSALAIDVVNNPDNDWDTPKTNDPNLIIHTNPDEGGMHESEGGAFKLQESSYWGDHDADPQTPDQETEALYHSPERFWDVEIGSNVSADAIVINLDLSGSTSGLQYDLTTNWDAIWFDYDGTPIDPTIAGSQSPYVDGSLGDAAAWDRFRVSIDDIESGALDDLSFYVRHWDYESGSHNEFIARWTLNNTSEGVGFEIAGASGELSSTQIDSILSEIGFDYNDLATAKNLAHSDVINADIDIFRNGVDLTAAIGLEDQGQFRFGNYAPELVHAEYNGHLVELMYDSSAVSSFDWWATTLHEGLSESDWSGFLGFPDPSLFEVTDSSGGIYDVTLVIPERSALLVLDREVAAGEVLTVTYTDPVDDQIRFVAQSEMGVDSPSASAQAQYASYSGAQFNVLSGATLGWDNWLEEQFYVGDQNWNTDAGDVVGVDANGVASVEIRPVDEWRENSHYSLGATGFEGSEYVRVKLELQVLNDAGSISPGPLAISQIIDPNNAYQLYSWKWVIEGTSDPSLDVAETAYELAEWVVPDGYPAGHMTMSTAGFFTGIISGGDFNDNLDFALNGGSLSVFAGAGDDYLGGSIFASDYLDGGDGTDIVRVNGMESDYSVVEISPGVFEISRDTSGYQLDASGQIIIPAGDFVDQGTTDTLVNIEGIQFEDGYRALTLDGMQNAVEIRNFTIDQIASGEETATIRLSLAVSSDVREALLQNSELDDIDLRFDYQDGTVVRFGVYESYAVENSAGTFDIDLEIPAHYLADGANATIEEIRLEETQNVVELLNPEVSALVDYAVPTSQAPSIDVTNWVVETLNGEQVIRVDGTVSDPNLDEFHVFFDIGIESQLNPAARDWIHADLDASAIQSGGTFSAYIDRHDEHWDIAGDRIFWPEGPITFNHISAVVVDETGASSYWDWDGYQPWMYVSRSNDIAFTEGAVPDLGDIFRVDQDWHGWIAEFEDLPDALVKTGDIFINFDQNESFDFSLDGSLVTAANTASFDVAYSGIFDSDVLMPSIPFDSDQINEISFRGSEANETVYFGNDTPWGDSLHWSVGNDHYIFADDDRGNAIYFEQYTREQLQDGVPLQDLTGVWASITNGDLLVETEYGIVTGDGVYKLGDTSSNDIFVGSSSDESFRFQYGGSDVVTGGGGADRYRIEYRDTAWATGDQPIDYSSVYITDYSTNDVLRFEEFGFKSESFDSEVFAYYDRVVDQTVVSVVTDSVNEGRAEFIVDGEWLIGTSELKSFSDSRDDYAEVRLVSADVNQLASEIVDVVSLDVFDYSVVHLEIIPDAFLGTGVIVDATGTQATITLDGIQYDLNGFATDSYYTEFRGSSGNDEISVSGSSIFRWSEGANTLTGDSTAQFTTFLGGSYGLLFDKGQDAAGLTFDLSTGVLSVETGYGTTTGYYFNEIFDTRFDDVILGSSGDEAFKTQFGGYDVVSGGLGVDQFEVRYRPERLEDRLGDSDRWWDVISGMEITDYETGEIIELQSMGFDGLSYADEISVRYDAGLDQTIIGVATDAVNQDFVFINGEFELDLTSVTYVPEFNYVTPPDTVRLSLLEVGDALITTTS
ncbi:hypothetical protein N9L29_04840, partial [Litoricolaceae bacterium]|nr:hypothetical protein [Litorivicinaceae bacterium]